VGAHWERARETAIIPENINESKGLLPTVVVRHALERTDFFGQLAPFGALHPARFFPAFRHASLSDCLAGLLLSPFATRR
jgi:hypothetical protein